MNIAKHGIDFRNAITAFDDPDAMTHPDVKHSEKEKREWLIGLSDTAGLIVVVFTIRDGKYRIISARRARRKELRLYEKNT